MYMLLSKDNKIIIIKTNITLVFIYLFKFLL